MSRQIGVYFETWVPDSATSGNLHNLSKINNPINTVYLAFAQPNCYYKKGSNSFKGTGLQFNSSFKIIKEAIGILKGRGIKVFLAVGGGSYWSSITDFYAKRCIDLMVDLGCDGIDIDWEVGEIDSGSSVVVIKSLKDEMPRGHHISFTCFSTGAFTPITGDRWRGMNREALKECSGLVDQVNVMSYDAGPDFDEIESFKSFRKLYKGRINMGFEVGRHGWGTAILQYPEAKKNLEYVSSESKAGGCFVWAYYKDATPGISTMSFLKLAQTVFHPPRPPMKPTFSCPSSVLFMCPNCSHRIKVAASDGGPKV